MNRDGLHPGRLDADAGNHSEDEVDVAVVVVER